MTWIINHMGIMESISFLISALFCVLSIRLMIAMDYFSEDMRYRWNIFKHISNDTQRIMSIWKKILDLVVSHDPHDWRQAVVFADALLDEVLKIAGYRGRSVEERLAHVDEAALPTIGMLRRVRMRVFALLAEDEPHLEQHQVKELLREYRQVFKQLGMME